MSSIGPINIAGAFAGAQRSDAANTDQKQARSTEQSRKLDQQQLSSQLLDDVGASDHSADRDADGRDVLEETVDDSTTGSEASERQAHTPRVKPSDADGQRGLSLDLDA